MKKLLSFALGVVLLWPRGAAAAEAAPVVQPEGVAVSTTQSVEVDGVAVEFETYALLDANGYPTNYAKLRDVAWVLRGTDAGFAVDWSAQRGVSIATGQSYTADGTEMSTPYSGDRDYYLPEEVTAVDGQRRAISAIRLYDDNGNGYTYYKLRDLGSCLGFLVDWEEGRGVFIDTTKVYSGANRTDVAALAGTWTGTLDLSPALAAAADSQPQLRDYFRFDGAAAPVALTADRTGQYTITLLEEDFNAALAQVRAAFVAGMMDYAEDQFQETMGLSLDQALAQNGMDRQSFQAQFETLFDDGMAQAAGQMLLQFNRPAFWTAEQAATVRTASGGLTLTLDDGTRIDFTRL